MIFEQAERGPAFIELIAGHFFICTDWRIGLLKRIIDALDILANSFVYIMHIYSFLIAT